MSHDLPTPPEIARSPEIAALAILELTLEVAARALVAAHPELDGDRAPEPSSPPARSALSVLERGWKLTLAIELYRSRLSEDPSAAGGADDGPSW